MSLRDKSVLVTGGSGFLGRHVCEELSGRCRVVCAFNMRDKKHLHHLGSADIVVHLAAYCGGIGLNANNPRKMLCENISLAMEVTAPLRITEKTVLIGSVCSYPEHCPIPFKESDIWNGYPEPTNAPYGIAKRVMMELGADRASYGCNVITLIPTNLYGPGDHFEEHRSHVIPAIIRKMAEARDSGAGSVTLWGSGSATRDFLHVRDAARAIVDATERYDSPEPMNLGSGREVSIRCLASIIANATGYTGEIIWDMTKPDGQPRRCLDISRAREAIGFEPTIELEEGIRETVEWYEKQRATVAA